MRDWILDLEFNYNKIPRPDVSLFLDVPMNFINDRLNSNRKGGDRDYLKGIKDIHEESLPFQEKVRDVYLSLQKYVDDLQIINCQGRNGEMKPADVIFELIRERINDKL
ncbi:MAG TPA: hypothetical protein ENN61_04460 [Bacteroidaceae bacterium]|nr:hypothetical protein [Bacteroidaceae bacterium]